MDEVTKQKTLTAVRTVLLALGGLLTEKGVADDATVQAVVSAVVVLATAGWAIYSSHRKAVRADERESNALNAGISIGNQSTGNVQPVPPEQTKAVIAAVQPQENP